MAMGLGWQKRGILGSGTAVHTKLTSRTKARTLWDIHQMPE